VDAPDVDWKDILLIAGPVLGFLGGLVTNFMQKMWPAYPDLLKEVAELRAELATLREANQGLYDTLEDERREQEEQNERKE